jgi:hypothetical protein
MRKAAMYSPSGLNGNRSTVQNKNKFIFCFSGKRIQSAPAQKIPQFTARIRGFSWLGIFHHYSLKTISDNGIGFRLLSLLFFVAAV